MAAASGRERPPARSTEEGCSKQQGEGGGVGGRVGNLGEGGGVASRVGYFRGVDG